MIKRELRNEILKELNEKLNELDNNTKRLGYYPYFSIDHNERELAIIKEIEEKYNVYIVGYYEYDVKERIKGDD